jgi:hypothetical protein
MLRFAGLSNAFQLKSKRSEKRLVAHLTPLSFGRRVRCNGREIDFEKAVWFMDKELFRRARDGMGYAEWERDLRIRSAEQDAPRPEALTLISAQTWANCLWDEYRKLHRKHYNCDFDPPLPDLFDVTKWKPSWLYYCCEGLPEPEA